MIINQTVLAFETYQERFQSLTAQLDSYISNFVIYTRSKSGNGILWGKVTMFCDNFFTSAHLAADLVKHAWDHICRNYPT